jgi:phospholipase/carboxylesterase
VGLGVALALAAVVAACNDGSTGMPSARPASRFVEQVVAARATSAGGRPPLLVLLHGIGADEHDLVGLARELDPRFLVVSVRAPRPYHTGYAWFQIDWRPDGTIVPDVAQARDTLADLVRWLDAAPARLGADPARVYLLGFSQGAMMSLGVIGTAPERLAGVVALSGLFSDQLFERPAPDDAVAKVPLFVAHGTHDEVLPIANGRAIRDHFQPIVHDFTYREYPIPHAIGPDELNAVATWLGEHLDRPR